MHLTVSPENVKYVLVDNFKNYPKGPFWRRVFKDLLGGGIFNADGFNWRKQRKVASNEFSARTLKTFMFDTFVKHAKLTMDVVRLETEGDADGRVDVQELMARYTLESIGIIGFGVSVGAFSSSGASISSEFGDAFNTATVCTADRFVDPTWPLKRILGVGKERELKDSIKVVRGFAIKVIEERRATAASGETDLGKLPDLLSRFMAKEKGGKGEDRGEFEFTNDELYYIIINFVLAGRDTTANSLTWTLWELSKEKNCRVVSKIRAETSRVRKELGLGEGEVTHELVSKCIYLKAAVHEGLRLHPPVPQDIKECLSDDVLPDGTEVRKGDRVMFVTWVMARMEEQWGEDSTEFKPERFITEEGNFRPPEGSKLPIFLAGPRLCLGKDMAMLSSSIMLTMLLDNFNASGGEDVEYIYDVGLTIWSNKGMPLKLKGR